MRRLAVPLLLLVGTALGLYSDAGALTSPISGAVALPAGADLRLPFPAGARVRVLSGYGPSGGSSLHAGTEECCKANDHYALDLDYADEPDGGLGMPLVAAMDGTVVRAGWATAGWANYGLRVILRHDLGDGHVYHSLYAHMNALDPAITEGATVSQGQVLGELGRSCMGALSCGSFSSPHIHFSLHRDSTVGGSGTGGSYGGNAVVPEPIGGHEDLTRFDVLTSGNTGTVECGDGFCNGGETTASCPSDCPPCGSIPPAGRIVDDQEICFERGGTPDYWRQESAGYADNLWWTHATDSSSVDDYAVWSLGFEEGGEYRVEAYTDGAWAQSRRAEYRVRHAGGEDAVVVDQSAVDGWNALGTFSFAAGGDQWIRLDDNTGEPFSERKQLVFDALRLTRVGGGADAGVPPGTDGGTIDPTADGGTTDPATDGGTVRPGVDGGAITGDGGASTSAGRGDVSGGCSVSAASPSGWPALAGLGLLLLSAAASRASSRRRGSRRT